MIKYFLNFYKKNNSFRKFVKNPYNYLTVKKKLKKMFTKSPQPSNSLEHRRIFTPLKENVNTPIPNTPTPFFKPHSVSAHKEYVPNIQRSCEKLKTSKTIEKSKTLSKIDENLNDFPHLIKNSNKYNIITFTDTDEISIDKENQGIPTTRRSKNNARKYEDFEKNIEFYKKFNILLEKNETLNVVLEKKINKLHYYSKENTCLTQEIEHIRKENAEILLEREGYKVKIKVLEEEIIKKNENIDNFLTLNNEMQNTMMILKDENKKSCEKVNDEFQKVINEKSEEISKLQKEISKKSKLEGQLLIFIKENEKLRKIIEEKHEENELLNTLLNKIPTLESRLIELQNENVEKQENLLEKSNLLKNSLNDNKNMETRLIQINEEMEQLESSKRSLSQELEILKSNYSILEEKQDDLRRELEENRKGMKDLQSSQKLILDENISLREENREFQTKLNILQENAENSKNLEIHLFKVNLVKLESKLNESQKNEINNQRKISDLQNSHLSLAKNYNEKIEDYQRKLREKDEEIQKNKENLRKAKDESKLLRVDNMNMEKYLKNSQEMMKKLSKESEEVKAREIQVLTEIECQKKENFELNEKIKIKIKGYSILKSHFYAKYEELIKQLMQKDKELEKYKQKNINCCKETENVGKEKIEDRVFEFFRQKKQENEETHDSENELNKDLMLLKDGKLIKECLDSNLNTTINSFKDA